MAAGPNYIRSEHIKSRGKYECGLNWQNNGSMIQENAICGESSNIDGSEIVTGWRCKCAITSSEKQVNTGDLYFGLSFNFFVLKILLS